MDELHFLVCAMIIDILPNAEANPSMIPLHFVLLNAKLRETLKILQELQSTEGLIIQEV